MKTQEELNWMASVKRSLQQIAEELKRLNDNLEKNEDNNPQCDK